MKQTVFMKQLSSYFGEHLIQVRHCSQNTIKAYADGFVVFFRFFEEMKNKKYYLIDYSDFTPQTMDDYVLWMQNSLKYSASTQKHRITAISAFLKYASRRDMMALSPFNTVLGVTTPKSVKTSAPHFTVEEMKIILHLPDCTSAGGLRDAALLCLMYDSGARAQEMCDILVGDVTFGNSCTVKLSGKGNKSRMVPISDATSSLIKKYLNTRGKIIKANSSEPLFSSQRSERMTTASIRYIVQKYVAMAKETSPEKFPKAGYSPHSFRHSKAVHMLKAGVPLIYIRNFLGHESVQTTEIYLKMNQESVSEILQKRNVDVITQSSSIQRKEELPSFLISAR